MKNIGKKPRKLTMTSDLNQQFWVFKFSPKITHPYWRLMRIDRPIGTWLLLLPTLWGLALCRNDISWQELLIDMILLSFGAIIMRGAGCVWNDITDRDIDGLVARTRVRPIPSGEVSVQSAVFFCIFLCLMGLAILLLLPKPSIIYGLASVLLFIPYPFMKRITWFPQFWLGMTFNWGIIIANGASGYYPDGEVWFLYGNAILWTLFYDTIYACQDKEDDAMAGIKSTALKFGKKIRPILAAIMGVFLLNLIILGIIFNYGVFYFIGLLMALCHAYWQFRQFNPDDAAGCLRLFKSNKYFGIIIFASLFFR